jgi:hypothetical protein
MTAKKKARIRHPLPERTRINPQTQTLMEELVGLRPPRHVFPLPASNDAAGLHEAMHAAILAEYGAEVWELYREAPLCGVAELMVAEGKTWNQQSALSFLILIAGWEEVRDGGPSLWAPKHLPPEVGAETR